MPTDQNEFTAANRANWDDRVEPHLRGYRVDRFAAEPDRISEVVRDDVPLMAPYRLQAIGLRASRAVTVLITAEPDLLARFADYRTVRRRR